MKHIARKRFGQHFLTDIGIIEEIVRAIDPRPEDLMVEIGPGLGALTDPLVAAKIGGAGGSVFEPLHVVELDRDLVVGLRKHFAAGQVVVHEADALNFDFPRLGASCTRPLRVVGNLPYNISSPLLFHLVDAADKVRDQYFMLQKEVVERMVAIHGDPAYGRLSVMLQVRYRMDMLFEVPPGSFDPPPKVLSAVVRMVPRPPAQSAIVDDVLFGKLVKLAFSQRRKMLRNTLRDYAPEMEAVGITPTARAEEIPVETFVSFANRVGESSNCPQNAPFRSPI